MNLRGLRYAGNGIFRGRGSSLDRADFEIQLSRLKRFPRKAPLPQTEGPVRTVGLE